MVFKETRQKSALRARIKNSKYGPNSKIMKSTKRTFLQTAAEASCKVKEQNQNFQDHKEMKVNIELRKGSDLMEPSGGTGEVDASFSLTSSQMTSGTSSGTSRPPAFGVFWTAGAGLQPVAIKASSGSTSSSGSYATVASVRSL